MKKTIRIFAVVLSVVLLALALVACAPKNDPDKAKAALEKNGYTVVKTDGRIANAASALLGGESKLDATVTGTKTVEDKDGNRKTEYITIIYYKTSADAKDAWEDAQKDAEKDKKDDSDWVVKRSGKMIYWGTKAAVKAAS